MRLHLLLASAAAVVMAAPAMVQPASAQTQPQATAAAAPMQDVVVDEVNIGLKLQRIALCCQ